MYVPKDRRDLLALVSYALVIGVIMGSTLIGSAYVGDVLRESRAPDLLTSLVSENRSEETHLSKAVASANEIRQALASSIPPIPSSEFPSAVPVSSDAAPVSNDSVTTQAIAAKQEVLEDGRLRRRFASRRSKVASRPSIYRQARHRTTFESHLERALAALRR